MESATKDRRRRIVVSEWSQTHLAALSAAKGYPEGFLYTVALDVGTTALIAHFRRVEERTAAGYDTSTLEGLLPLPLPTPKRERRPKRGQNGA